MSSTPAKTTRLQSQKCLVDNPQSAHCSPVVGSVAWPSIISAPMGDGCGVRCLDSLSTRGSNCKVKPERVLLCMLQDCIELSYDWTQRNEVRTNTNLKTHIIQKLRIT